jgi:hypothetical protein
MVTSLHLRVRTSLFSSCSPVSSGDNKAAAKSNQGAGKEELEEDKCQFCFASFSRVKDLCTTRRHDDIGQIVPHFRIQGEHHDDWLSLLQPSVLGTHADLAASSHQPRWWFSPKISAFVKGFKEVFVKRHLGSDGSPRIVRSSFENGCSATCGVASAGLLSSQAETRLGQS